MTQNRMNKSEDLVMQASTYPSETAKRRLPEVRVSFHTARKCYQTVGRKLERGEERDPTYQLLSVSTSKTLSNPAGGFTITLAGSDWSKLLVSNDLVIIRMGYVGDEQMSTVMIGLIDRVRLRRSVQGGKPEVQTTIVGRDFGKMLLKSQLKFYPEIGAKNASAEKYFLTSQGWIKMLGIFTAKEVVEGTPNVILEKIMTAVLPKLNDTSWTVYDEKKSVPTPKKVNVTNIIGWQFEATDFFIPFHLAADSFEGSIWNLMERAVQKPFTELYIDTIDGEGMSNEQGVTKAPVVASTTKKPTTTTTTTTTTTADKYHTVVKGNTLWALAGTYYKDSTQWRKIWEANKDLLIARDKRNASDHGHWIYPGQKLRIPGVTETVTKTSQTNNSVRRGDIKAPDDFYYPRKTIDFGYDTGKVMLTYRMTPFDTVNWNKLKMHTLEAVDVIEEDLGHSDDEHYNVFWAGSSINPLGDINIKTVSPPLMNEPDVRRYGLSPLEVEIEGLAIEREKEAQHKVALESLSNKYSKILQTWYQDNHKHEEGTIICRGQGQFRIAQRIFYKPQNIEGYIEGVNQTFNVYTDWTTTITMTRGVKRPLSAIIAPAVQTILDKVPKPAAQAPAQKPGGSQTATTDQYYTVVKGDTLWALAKKYYGAGTQWRKIWDANKDMLIARDKRNATDHGHWIYPGQKLRIPK